MNNGIECQEPKKYYKHKHYQIYLSVCDCCAVQLWLEDFHKQYIRNVDAEYVNDRLNNEIFIEITEEQYTWAEEFIVLLNKLENVIPNR